MTEDEAKKKWCPFTFRPGKDPVGAAIHHEHTRCIGSECMAWRQRVDKAATSQLRNSGGCGVIEAGYCGLAGKP